MQRKDHPEIVDLNVLFKESQVGILKGKLDGEKERNNRIPEHIWLD